jgi:hypothetical protein
VKKKIGPLPMWAWIVIIGGTIGIVLYERSKSSSTGTTDPNQVDPATGLTYSQEGAEEQAGIDPLSGQTFASEAAGSSGGGSGTDGSGDTLSTDPTLADIDSQLVGIGAQLSTMQGGTGLTDTPTPIATFQGEVQDVASGLTALQQLQKAIAPVTTPGKTKKSNGSGNAGKSGTASPPARRPVKTVLDPKTGTRKTVVPTKHVVSGKKH